MRTSALVAALGALLGAAGMFRDSSRGSALARHVLKDERRAAPPVLDNRVARTPPMGWNSWNKFAMRADGSLLIPRGSPAA